MDDKFAKLYQLVKSPASFGTLVDAVATAVAKSIKERPIVRANLIVPSVTKNEENRRVDFCVDFVLEMIRDKGWAVERAGDRCHAALIAMLDGGELNVEGDGMWAADG